MPHAGAISASAKRAFLGFEVILATEPLEDEIGCDAEEADPDRVVPVRFVAAGGYVVAALEVELRPRACRAIDQRTARPAARGGQAPGRLARSSVPCRDRRLPE